MVTDQIYQARAGVTKSAPFGPDRLGLSKELSMKSLHKMFSRVVTFPKWVFTFDLRISFVPRTYGVYLEYRKEMEFKEDFDSQEAALFWAESRTRWITATNDQDVAVTLCETTGGRWKLIDTCSAGVCQYVVLHRPEPKF